MPTTKSPFLSKTIWINSIGFILMALLPFLPQLAGAQTWLQDTSHVALIGSVWGVLNIILRFITKDAIQLGD